MSADVSFSISRVDARAGGESLWGPCDIGGLPPRCDFLSGVVVSLDWIVVVEARTLGADVNDLINNNI